MIGEESTSFQKAFNLEKQLKMTSTEKLMPRKVQQLRHPHFEWNLVLTLATLPQSFVS